jgi:broad specificity phosphatase PhoE
MRKKQGIGGPNGEWDIWKEGCPGGEYDILLLAIRGVVLMFWDRSSEEITRRCDRLIKEIREKYHAPVIGKPRVSEAPRDVLLVAHGHILRAFAMRWAGMSLADGPTFLLEAGGVGTLSYEHHQLNEPAILLGGGFMVDVVEKSGMMEQGEVEHENE